MNHQRFRRAASLRSFVVLAFSSVLLTGCTAVSSLESFLFSSYIDIATSISADLTIEPTLSANAGSNELVVAGETHILDGSATASVSGSGTRNTSPTPAIVFAWTITDSPVPDADVDGDIDDADFAAAGVTLEDADTAFPRFRSDLAGAFVIRLDASWAGGNFGRVLTSSDSVTLSVFNAVP